MPHKPRWERRGSPRAELAFAAQIVVPGGSRVGSYVIENLSAGGALMTGGPLVEPGSNVRVALDLPNRRQPMILHARVVRSHGPRAFAVVFEHRSPHTEDLIHDLVLSHLERLRGDASRPTVLVVDDCELVGRAIARQLATLGCRAATATTPLDAVDQLELNEATIRTALVDLFLDQADGLDFLTRLADERPLIRRVLMSGQARPCQLRLALTRKQVHAVLNKPWTRDELAQVVGQRTRAVA